MGKITKHRPGHLVSEIDSARLEKIAAEVRQFLLPVWRDWPKRPSEYTIVSAGTCIQSSIFLQRVFAGQGIKSDFCWGYGERREGFNDNGRWRRHAWLTVGKKIVDITADQFGEIGIVITPSTDKRYRYSNNKPAVKLLAHIGSLDTEVWWSKWQVRTLSDLLPPAEAFHLSALTPSDR